MASFTAGTTFTDGVANDVTAAKLGALVTNATPTSGFIQDRTSETVIASNDTVLIGDASDSNNLKRMTVDNLMKADMSGNINSTSGTITSLTTGTGTAASPAIVSTGDANNGLFFPAADTIAVSTNGTERVRVDSSGNVGIGTTSPSTKLDVLCSPNAGIRVTDGTQVGIMYASGVGGIVAGTTSTHPYILYSNNTERLRIDSSGNVGIGTTSPTDAKLSVHANNLTIPAISARYSSAGYKMGFGVYNVLGYPYLGLNCNQVSSSNNQTYDLSAHATKLDMSIDGSTPGFAFSTAASGTAGSAITWSERLRIDSSGNVGIGTTSPATPLNISTSASSIVSETVRLENSSNTSSNGNKITWRNAGQTTEAAFISGFREGAATSFGVAIGTSPNFTSGGTNAVERLRIDSSGNVGIGTTSPAYKFVVSSSGSQGIEINPTSSTLTDIYSYNRATSAYINSQINALNLIVSTGVSSSTERLRIDSSGNVGIGTTGAVNKLEIVGSLGRGAPVTKTGDFTLADTENWLIVNKGSSCTVTLPAASSWTGREFTIKVITAHTVVSASSNVVPRNSATAGTAILAATAGSWATLVSNGTNWVIMCGS